VPDERDDGGRHCVILVDGVTGEGAQQQGRKQAKKSTDTAGTQKIKGK
jgi:hypothetical protein